MVAVGVRPMRTRFTAIGQSLQSCLARSHIEYWFGFQLRLRPSYMESLDRFQWREGLVTERVTHIAIH